MRFVGRLLRALLLLVAIAVAIPAAGLAWGFLTTPAPPAASLTVEPKPDEARRLASDIPGYRRSPAATFLTYPEWSIVHAAREYAGIVEGRPPHAFAFLASISRFWQDYAIAARATSGAAFDFDNHLMLVVIGISHTVENLVQAAWENTLGRLTSFWFPTPQDQLLARYAADYAAFLDHTPWYAYDYAAVRAGLWSEPSGTGFAAIRSWERRLGFSLALWIKQFYAGLIASGLDATSDPAALEIHAWVAGPVNEAIAGEPETRIVLDLGEDGAVIVTPRYQAFTEFAPRAISRGLRFVEIAGNDTILATFLAGGALIPPEGARTVFAHPLPSDPGAVRSGIVVAVQRLDAVLPALAGAGARLEHLYDY